MGQHRRASARPRARLGLTRGLVASLTVVVLLAACGTEAGPSGTSSSSGSSSGDASLSVVTTTTVFADIVRNVGGDRIAVRSIIPAGVGPEDYEPKPDDARKLAGADLIVSNGVGLDDFLDKLVAATGDGSVARLVLGRRHPDDHRRWRPEPPFLARPEPGRGPLRSRHRSRADEARSSGGFRRTRRTRHGYAEQLEALDVANKSKIDTIPVANRKLVTFHDAFPYFAAHYGFEVIGVILANVGQEPSATELAALVEKVKAAHVKSVFSEAQFSPELAQTLAQEAGIASIVTTLYNDTVGPPPNGHLPHDDGVERRRDRAVAPMTVERASGGIPLPRHGGLRRPGRPCRCRPRDRLRVHCSPSSGPNGSGKSTLLKTIAGLPRAVLRDRRGLRRCAEVGGQTDRLRAAGRGCRLVLPRDRRRRRDDGSRPADRHRPIATCRRIAIAVADALETVGMTGQRDRQIGALSGGQRRRVFLAKALAARPDLYLLDEPVTGVDVTTQEDLMRILEAESAAGRTVVATTHDLASAAHHFHQVGLRQRQGRGVRCGGSRARSRTPGRDLRRARHRPAGRGPDDHRRCTSP